MRRTLLTAAAAAICSVGTLAAQTTDTTLTDPSFSDDVRSEEIYDDQPEIEVDETIAPGEYELREIDPAEEPETDLDMDSPVDTMGMEPKGADLDADVLMEPQPEAMMEEGGVVPAEPEMSDSPD